MGIGKTPVIRDFGTVDALNRLAATAGRIKNDRIAALQRETMEEQLANLQMRNRQLTETLDNNIAQSDANRRISEAKAITAEAEQHFETDPDHIEARSQILLGNARNVELETQKRVAGLVKTRQEGLDQLKQRAAGDPTLDDEEFRTLAKRYAETNGIIDLPKHFGKETFEDLSINDMRDVGQLKAHDLSMIFDNMTEETRRQINAVDLYQAYMGPEAVKNLITYKVDGEGKPLVEFDTNVLSEAQKNAYVEISKALEMSNIKSRKRRELEPDATPEERISEVDEILHDLTGGNRDEPAKTPQPFPKISITNPALGRVQTKVNKGIPITSAEMDTLDTQNLMKKGFRFRVNVNGVPTDVQVIPAIGPDGKPQKGELMIALMDGRRLFRENVQGKR